MLRRAKRKLNLFMVAINNLTILQIFVKNRRQQPFSKTLQPLKKTESRRILFSIYGHFFIFVKLCEICFSLLFPVLVVGFHFVHFIVFNFGLVHVVLVAIVMVTLMRLYL
jgi:hypothetical protein